MGFQGGPGSNRAVILLAPYNMFNLPRVKKKVQLLLQMRFLLF